MKNIKIINYVGLFTCAISIFTNAVYASSPWDAYKPSDVSIDIYVKSRPESPSATEKYESNDNTNSDEDYDDTNDGAVGIWVEEDDLGSTDSACVFS